MGIGFVIRLEHWSRIGKLKYLDGWTAARQRNAAFYDKSFAGSGLRDKIVPPKVIEHGRHIFNQYVVRVQQRDELKDFLAQRNIGTEIYYPVPLHLQKCFEYLKHAPGDFPESERAARETLALPIYPELDETQLRHVVATIAEFYR